MCGLWLLTIPGLILSIIGLRKEPRTAATVGTIFGGIGIIEFILLGPLMLGILLPALASARDSAQKQITTNRIHAVQTASETFKADNGEYPTSMDQLEEAKLLPPKEAKDSWDNGLKLVGGGETKPVVTSSGPDGEFGTEDDLPSSSQP
jgi:competence protein ComGC